MQLLPAETRNASTIHDRGAGVAGVSMDLAENWILLRSIATIGSYWTGRDSKLPLRPTCQASDDSNWTAGRPRVLKLSEIDLTILTDDPSFVLQQKQWMKSSGKVEARS